MATANITFGACGGSSDSMRVYYGKTLLVTGDPISGTGWTLYTGAPLAPSTTSVAITGLDYNVQYTFYRYCHCPVSGDTTPEIDEQISYECPSFQTINSSSNQIDYIINVPSSSNNTGTWIQRILVEIYDSTGTTLFGTNVYLAPFSSSISGSFLGLLSQTTYKLKIKYSNNASTMSHDCVTQDVDTTPACVPPTVNVSNLTGTGFDVTWSVPASYFGDTYNVLINSVTVASGLPYGSQPYTATGLTPNTLYTVQVVRNFGFGGQCSSTVQNVNTPLAVISGVIDLNRRDTGSCTHQGYTEVNITFSAPTPVALVIYFGSIRNVTSSSAKYADGYDLFAIPPGVIPDPGPNHNFPWFINVPSGTSSITLPPPGSSSAIPSDYIQATAGGSGTIWSCSCLETTIDLYVKIQTPVGYAANFSKGTGDYYHGSAVLHNL